MIFYDGPVPSADAADASRRKNPLGPTGDTVAANVQRLRTSQNLTFAALAQRLSDMGRPIPPLGLRKIERGDRRVDADDLVGLARALGVTPIVLLMPHTEVSSETVTATALPDSVTAEVLWDWLQGFGGLYRGNNEWVESMHVGHPPWKVRGYYESAFRDAVEGSAARESIESWLAEHGDD